MLQELTIRLNSYVIELSLGCQVIYRSIRKACHIQLIVI